MFLHSPILDTIVLIVWLSLFREFVLSGNTANKAVKLLTQHVKLWIRFGVWVILSVGISYMTLSDFSLLDGRYYNECVYTLLTVLYLIGVYGNFVGYKYGPRNDAFKQKNSLQRKAMILLPILILLMYFF